MTENSLAMDIQDNIESSTENTEQNSTSTSNSPANESTTETITDTTATNLSDAKDSTNLAQLSTQVIDLTEQENTGNEQKSTTHSQIIDLSAEIEQESTSTDMKLPPNVILLGSKITKNFDEKKIDSTTIDVEFKIPKTEEKVEKRRPKRQSELERLEVAKEEVVDEEYIAFTDNVNVYKKYKLRKINNDPSPPKQEIETPTRMKATLQELLNCHRCSAVFDTRYSLLAHLKIHADIFLCLLCSKRFNSNLELISHKLTHKKQSFLCTECKLAFSEHFDYLIHYYKHIKEENIQCLECEMTINCRNMKAHVQSHFSKAIQCPTCFVGFQNKGSYENHRIKHGWRTHKKFSKYKCRECDQLVNSNQGDFDRHMFRHTGVKKYQCLFCGQCFVTDSNRNIHSRTHLETSDYKCDICGKVYNVEYEFKRHLLRHGAKTIECEICSKKFYDKHNLQTHVRTYHMNKDLYPCPECEYKAPSQTGLRSHLMRAHTTDRPFPCDICDLKFKTKRDLVKHVKSKKHKRNLFGCCN